MRKQFFAIDSDTFDRDLAPWACEIVRADGGYWAFESVGDVMQWERAEREAKWPIVRAELETQDRLGDIVQAIAVSMVTTPHRAAKHYWLDARDAWLCNGEKLTAAKFLELFNGITFELAD